MGELFVAPALRMMDAIFAFEASIEATPQETAATYDIEAEAERLAGPWERPSILDRIANVRMWYVRCFDRPPYRLVCTPDVEYEISIHLFILKWKHAINWSEGCLALFGMKVIIDESVNGWELRP